MKKVSLAEKWAKDIRKGGFDDGKLQGQKQGREESFRETLLTIIAKRFDKKLTQEFVERCQKEKSVETLQAWVDEAIIADFWRKFLKAIK